MRILVTGGAGYLGSVFCPYLLRKGYEVTVLDDFYRGAPTSLLQCCAHSDFKLVKGSVLDYPLLAAKMEWADAVVALAALVGREGEKDLERLRQVSLAGAKNVAMLKRHNQLVVFPMTTAGYVADGNSVIDETTPMVAQTSYAEAKLDAEKILLDVGAVSLRLASVFGLSPAMRHDSLLNALVHDAVKTGTIDVFDPGVLRNFIHVKDVARVFERMFMYHTVVGEIYNIGLPCMTKFAVAEVVSKVTGCKVRIIKGKDPDGRGGQISCEKIKRELRFYPVWTIEDGVEELVRVYGIL